MLGSLLNKVAGLKETPTQVFFYENCEIFKNTFFNRTPPVAASEQTEWICVVQCVAKELLVIWRKSNLVVQCHVKLAN